MAPFGIQIVIYLFLAGIASGAAFMGSIALDQRKPVQLRGGKRALGIAIACAAIGGVFLILDLASPGDFLLILTSANTASAISWGARILVIFSLSAIFILTVVRNWGESDVQRGFRGGEVLGLWVLRIAALGLAIYPGFVLRQGEAFELWQNTYLIPLIAISGFHSGMSAFLLVSSQNENDKGLGALECVLGLAQICLLALAFAQSAASIWYYIALFFSVLAIRIPSRRFSFRLRHIFVFISAFIIRYWLISAGQLA